MTASTFAHTSVLLHESVSALAIKPDGLYIDATFGRGGHSTAILENLNQNGRLIAFDRDLAAIEAAKKFSTDKRFSIVHEPFSEMERVIQGLGLLGEVDGILMDLGVSSPQLDDAERGFSFMRNGPLDMRMDRTRGVSAADWLAYADEADITKVIKEFGEEKFGKRIAHAIVNARQIKPLTTTAELAQLVDEAVPVKDKYKHPATRTFQAIRIFVNDELGEVLEGLNNALACLIKGGRLAVISFHSLEDRYVKRFIREQSRGKQVPPGMPILESELAATRNMKAIGKAIKPSAAELETNVRCRSSVLRVAERI